MSIKIYGRTYEDIVGSDVERDGMYLEVQDWNGKLVAEILYSDVDHMMTFSSFRPDIPLALIEWMISSAKERLPPMSGGGS